MSFASAIGLGAGLDAAIADAAEQLAAEAGAARFDLAIAFVSAAYGSAIERLPQLLRPHLGGALLVGCNAGGLIGGGSEEEDEPGVALLCGRLPDSVLTCRHLEQATLPPLAASREHWWRLLDLAPESDRKSTRLNSSHSQISYAVFCLKKKKKKDNIQPKLPTNQSHWSTAEQQQHARPDGSRQAHKHNHAPHRPIDYTSQCRGVTMRHM